MSEAFAPRKLPALEQTLVDVRAQPEDAIRAPAETLLRDLATAIGVPVLTVVMASSLIDVTGALAGSRSWSARPTSFTD